MTKVKKTGPPTKATPPSDASDPTKKPKGQKPDQKKEQKPAVEPKPKIIPRHLTLEEAVTTAVERSRHLKAEMFWTWFNGLSQKEQESFRTLIEKKSNPDEARSRIVGKIALTQPKKKSRKRKTNG
ncbi:MAG: hypothetical protein NTV81_02405 [Candidatus Komeilibacteria bacterium]|nr:hypothetical protein [Candidatus Komeilibacteria bacterium]